jgi:hypothetical protein
MQFVIMGTGYSKDIGFKTGALFLSCPLFFKTNIFSKYKCLLPGSVPASCQCLGYVYGMMIEPFL